MSISVLMAAVGLLLLLGGGEVLLRGAASLAVCLGLSPLLIGLTVVAAATSMPELVVTVTSGIEGVPDLGVGNVIGSNIANILLVLGTAAVICPIATRPEHVLRDGMVLLTATVLFTAFVFISTVGRLEGSLMLVALVLYLVFSYYSDRRLNGKRSSDRAAQNRDAADQSEAGSNNPSQCNAPGADPTPDAALQEDTCVAETPARFGRMMAVVFIITGVGALVGGSHLLIGGAVDIATRLGLSEAVIGLTLVAVGTSLPELATAIVAGLRRHSEIALGNVLGSNLFNLLLVLGVLGLIVPFQVAQEMLSFDIWVMVGAAVVLLPAMMTGWRIGRREGAAFLIAYGIYIAMKFQPAVVGG